MTCPDCERYKESAKNWRHKAYELSGHPLPWERGDTWVGLTEDEVAQAMFRADAIITGPMQFKFAKEIEAKLKEKNNV